LPADGPDAPDGPNYAEALQELHGLLAEIERDDVDVDALAAKVRRAAELVELCRARIEAARVEVERVVATFDER
jgi:exodeoxyribonuclease VII small subunit